jgi:hypothetical protein
VSLSAYPPEIVPSGYGFDVTYYDTDTFEAYISGGPDDSPKLTITVIPHDLPADVKATAITINVQLPVDVLVTDTLIHTFEVPYESSTIPISLIPAFTSSFSPVINGYMVNKWLGH